MAYCIECGGPTPAKAKFCPACGTKIEEIHDDVGPQQTAVAATTGTVIQAQFAPKSAIEADAEPVSKPFEKPEIYLEPEAEDAPVAANDGRRSKAGLLAGLSLIALLVGGAGAYATGMLDSFIKPAPQQVAAISAPVLEKPVIAEPEVEPVAEISPEQTAYTSAIKSGRISELGAFAQDYPDSSLAQDAQVAALASLNRQGTELAYTTFKTYFPEVDLSGYAGAMPAPAIEPDVKPDAMKASLPETAPAYVIPTIRPSISTKTEELDAFMAQGERDYVLGVLDDMLNLSDLNETEATYLLNVRAKAETSLPFGDEVTRVETETTEPIAPQMASFAPTSQPVFDVAAVPIERFGAITPDAATAPGECDMQFSVGITGTPTSISANCTDPIFAAPAMETVAAWSYQPATLNGAPVQQDDMVVKIRFHLEPPEE